MFSHIIILSPLRLYELLKCFNRFSYNKYYWYRNTRETRNLFWDIGWAVINSKGLLSEKVGVLSLMMVILLTYIPKLNWLVMMIKKIYLLIQFKD